MTAPTAKSAAGRTVMAAIGPFIGLALVLGIFSINPAVRSTFLSAENFRTVAAQTVIVGLGALGMTLIIVSAGIDLSVGSVLALTSVVTALMLQHGDSMSAALLTAIAVGALVGLINGGLITGLRMTPFIVTLGTLGIARGVANWLAQEQAIVVEPHWLANLASPFPTPAWLILSPGVWMTLALAVVISLVLKYSVFGRYVFAIGSNEVAARLSGIRVDLVKIGVYALAGLFFGLGGIVQFGRLGMGDPTVDVGAELDIIAAVVIGGGSLNGGEGSILGSLIGALIMGFLRNGSQQMGWPAYVQQIIIGCVIIVAVALDRLRHRGAAA